MRCSAVLGVSGHQQKLEIKGFQVILCQLACTPTLHELPMKQKKKINYWWVELYQFGRNDCGEQRALLIITTSNLRQRQQWRRHSFCTYIMVKVPPSQSFVTGHCREYQYSRNRSHTISIFSRASAADSLSQRFLNF